MGGNVSYAGYVRTMVLNDDIDYDLAVICYGQNDDDEQFSMYYESIIRALHSKYEKCSIISILESAQKGYTTKMKEIQNIADYYEIPVADTIEPFKDDYDNLTYDDVHPNDEGHKLYAECIEKIIDKQVTVNTGFPDYDRVPINDSVTAFTNCDYIGVDQFEKDDLTYIIHIEKSGIFGIDYSYVSGENKAQIYIDGELFSAPTVTFYYDFSQRHILIVSDDCTVDKEIKIIFGNEEQAAGFYGVCFSYK